MCVLANLQVYTRNYPKILLSIQYTQNTCKYVYIYNANLTLKSIQPFLSMSNVRNTWSQNSSAFPDGKNILYISTNLAGVSLPFGQSCCNTDNEFPVSMYIYMQRLVSCESQATPLIGRHSVTRFQNSISSKFRDNVIATIVVL